MQFTGNSDQAAGDQLDVVIKYSQYKVALALTEMKIKLVDAKIAFLTNIQKLQALEDNDQQNQSSE